MHLKSLEVCGFKSFADKTEIVFERGLTAIVGPNGCGKCLAAESLVQLADGRVLPIGDLVEERLSAPSRKRERWEDGWCDFENPDGLAVVSLDPKTLKIEARPILAFVKRKAPGSLLRVRTRAGREIVTTHYHPFFTLERGQLKALKAEELEPRVPIAMPRHLPVEGRPVHLAGAALERFLPDDPIYIPEKGPWNSRRGKRQSARMATVVEGAGTAVLEDVHTLQSARGGKIRLPDALDESLARVLGYLISEGRTTASNQVWFVNEDPDVVADYCGAIGASFGSEVFVASYKGSTKDCLVFSKVLCLYLDRVFGLRVEGKSAGKRVPPQIFSSPDSVVVAFLSALFEGDGCLRIDESQGKTAAHWEYATASRALANGVISLLLRFGVFAVLRQKEKCATNTEARIKRKYYSVYVYGLKQVQRLARLLRFVGRKNLAVERALALECAGNPNHDTIPDIQPVIHEIVASRGISVKPLRGACPKLGAYDEGRCAASRDGLEEVARVLHAAGAPEADLEPLYTLARSDVRWDEIESIEKVPAPEWVYDLCVAETHNFVANDFFVHNSNIVDAIRWALGEQSARTLRGGAMQDVIFNGGGRRGPLGMAEVTLSFENEDRLLALERDEVRVTRRLYRSGESEYLLNGKACRLRDVRELLLDTGAGATAATFVEQGKIDALLHASPEERRHVLEEAAGIGRYKIRKKEALDRLEEVSRDRARLQDVLAEVAARHEEVKRQAEKASRYKGLRDRYRAVRLLAARHKRASLERRAEEARARAARLAEERAALEREGGALAAECERLFEEKRSQERAIREAELELRDLAAALEGRKRAAEHEARRAAECQDDLARDERAREALEAKARSLEKEIAAGREAAAAQQENEKGLGERLETLEESARELDARARAAQAEVEAAKRELLARLESESQLRNRLAELDARARVLAGREERLARKRQEVGAALAEREAEAAALGRAADEADGRARALEAALADATVRRDEADRAIRAAEEGFLEARRVQNEIEARIAALASLDLEGRDLDPGVRAVIDAGGPEVLGPLGDALSPAREHAAAIEAALGARAQWLLVKTREAAIGIARWLAKAEKGRAHLCVLADLTPSPQPSPLRGEGVREVLRENGFLGWAAELARPDEAARPLVERLLGRVAIVRDLEAALAIASLPAGIPCVTLAGDLVSADGIEAGKKGGQSRIERRSERHELEARRDAGAAALLARRESLETLRRAEREAAQALDRLRSEHHEARLAAFGAKKEREERERGLARLREEERLTTAELSEITTDRTDTHAALAEAEADLARSRAATGDLESRAADRAGALRALEVERAGVREELNDLKVRLARGAEQWEALKRAAARAERELEENKRSREALKLDLARARERLAEARGAADRYMAEALRMTDERAAREQKLEADRAANAATAKLLAERREADSVRQAALAKAADGAAAAERDERDARVRLEELASRVKDELDLDLAQLEAPPLAEPGAPPFSEAAADRECAGLRRQMEEIGPVNLEALDECEKLDERRKFLGVQAADLDRSEENLRATIRKINETSRKRFLETFEAVRENFKEIFRKLFGGGKADLVLEEGKDVLEAGVDVQARPPGKEARTISLLSGGEKTLATVALLFAVFRAKPGPFCVLDEVDAALDEHNVGRFVGIVREFLDHSQFLIVSHNKRTMAAADALYGVTMPEPGCSAPVSVRLGPAGQAAAAAVAAAVTPTAAA